MKRDNLILFIVLGVGVLALIAWMFASRQMVGLQYVEHTQTVPVYSPDVAEWDRQAKQWVDPDTRAVVTPDIAEPVREWDVLRDVPRARAGEPGVFLSIPRTMGLWLAALFTLFIFSFLYRDNPFYKAAESLVVGVSAAYAMVVGFWAMLVPNLFGRLWPDLIQAHILPEHTQERQWAYVIPLIFGLMLLWRLSPQGGWIARWPLAFIIGITAGLRLIGFLQADFAMQIQATIMPMTVMDAGAFDFWLSMRNIAIILGVLACLVYFFFSIEHKGVVGRTARVGIWVLMITFGAGFAYTVMGRITLLTRRVEFLFDDWLWLVGHGG